MEFLSLYILALPVGFAVLRIAYYIAIVSRRQEGPVDEQLAQRGETMLVGQAVRQGWAYAVKPIADVLARLKISPNTLTILCFAVSAAGGVIIGLGNVSVGGAVGVLGAGLDYFDGHLARRYGTASRAGAFLDSTLDRYGELFFFGGAACFFRGDLLLLAACLLTLGSSLVVSYARAKAEAFGFQLRGGLMQRTERVLVFCIAAVFGPYLDPFLPASWGVTIFGSAMVLLAVLTTQTAMVRTVNGFRALKDQALPEEPN